MGRKDAWIDSVVEDSALEVSGRSALAYDGVMGELPDWLAAQAPSFGAWRDSLLAMTNHSNAAYWVAIEAARLMGRRGDTRALPPRVRGVVNRLATLYCAVELGPRRGLEYLLGKDAAYGVRTSDGRERQSRARIKAGKETARIRREAGELTKLRVLKAYSRLNGTCSSREIAGKIHSGMEQPKVSAARIRQILAAHRKAKTS